MQETIVLSNAGASLCRTTGTGPRRLVVGTVDGIFVLVGGGGEEWMLQARGLEGTFVSAVTQLGSGTLLAATHGLGVARSTDGGSTWDWSSEGLEYFDLWSARSGSLGGRDVALVGSLPAHLMITTDDGVTWAELPAMRQVESVSQWCFPPPPRVGHVKEIVIEGDRLYVGIEIGALLRSDDLGATFTDLTIDPDPRECDIHRLLVDPQDPTKFIAAVGLVGFIRSEDDGATWRKTPVTESLEYPDAFVMHPDRPELLFVAAGVGWPPHWYARRRAQGRIARSRDWGRTWERLLGGLPDGQRSLFSALTIDVHPDSFELYTVDTDGQLFASVDGGDRWTMIAEVAPVSKGEFHRALAKNRTRLAGVDDLVFNETAVRRIAAVR
jgi:photosystem II stability/assembly factor-like uncharacterized protein